MSVKFNFLDGFCGAGGASIGIVKAGHRVACAINHNRRAIASHRLNHPNALHLNHDMREVDPHELLHLNINAFWWSPDCTHFSGAKGGQSRDADSRMLAGELYRFVDILNPITVFVENVTEFLTWGPLVQKQQNGNTVFGKDGNPIWVADPARKGEFYHDWVQEMIGRGYHYEYRKLNSGDFGSFTRRVRYYGIFTKSEKIGWPIQTHAKRNDHTGILKPWESCIPILDLSDLGDCIVTGRSRPALKNKTLARITYGMNRYQNDAFCKRHDLTQFTSKAYPRPTPTDPPQAIPAKDGSSLESYQPFSFLEHRYNSKLNVSSLGSPVNTITKNPKHSIVTILPNPIQGEEYYIGPANIPWPNTRIEGEYRLSTNIHTIWIRLLKLEELQRAQGFPNNYKLGPHTNTISKEFIGNSVVPKMAELLVKSNPIKSPEQAFTPI